MIKHEPMHCIVCKKTLNMIDVLHPMDGLHLLTYGHYGSTVFDPMDGSKLDIAVCDDCLTEDKEYCYMSKHELLQVEDIDQVVIDELKDAYLLNNRFEKVDCSDDVLQPDYELLQAIQTVLEYYMTGKEIKLWNEKIKK